MLLWMVLLASLGCQGNSQQDIWSDAEQGNIEAIKKYIAEGGDLNATHKKSGGTMLHQAAFAGRTEIVSLLLDAGADVDLPATTDYGTPLCWAASEGQAETAKLLIDAGANLNAMDRMGSRPLDIARIATTPNAEGRVQLLALLEEHGAVSALTPTISMHEAVKTDNVDLIKQHVLTGKDLNGADPDDGNTALILASILGHYGAVFVLTDYGAELDLKNKAGTTALYNAAFFCHPNIVKLLLIEGADPQTTNEAGQTITEVMEAEWSPELAELYTKQLKKYGIERSLEDIRKTRPAVVDVLHRLKNTKLPK